MAGAQKNKAAVQQDEDFLNGMGGVGTEFIGADDTSRSFLNIAQSNSPEITLEEDDPKAIKGLKLGHFYSPMHKKSYGKTLELVVLKQERVWNVWAPNRGGLVSVLPVNGCPVVRGDKGKMNDYDGNDVIETVNYYVILPDHLDDGMFVMPVKSTGIKHAKKWNTMIATLRTPDGSNAAAIYSGVWQLETIKNTNQSGTWYTFGDKQNTLVQFQRYIHKTEWLDGIKEAFELAKTLEGPKMAALPEGTRQAAITAGDSGLDETV